MVLFLFRRGRISQASCIVLKIEITPLNLGDGVFACVVPNSDRRRVGFMIHSNRPTCESNQKVALIRHGKSSGGSKPFGVVFSRNSGISSVELKKPFTSREKEDIRVVIVEFEF